MSNRLPNSPARVSGKLARVLVAAALTTVSASFVGCKPEAPNQAPVAAKPAPPLDVKLASVGKGDVSREVTLVASVVANQQVTLYSRVSGYLKTITVDKGDTVKGGALVAQIEAPELLADIAKFKAEVEIAEIEYKRAVDAQKKAPDLIVAQSLDTAKSRLAMAKANLERAETLLGFCRIEAPFSGVVTKRFVDPGAFVPAASAGSSPQTAAIVTIADFGTVRVQIPVPEAEAAKAQVGQPVKVAFEALGGKVFTGSITRSAQVLDDTTKTMLVEVDLKNESGELRPGMYAIAKISIETHKDTLRLPAEAVLFEKAGASVFVAAEGKAKKMPVKVGFKNETFVEILEGVKAGDQVIAFGKTAPANGQAVNITEAK